MKRTTALLTLLLTTLTLTACNEVTVTWLPEPTYENAINNRTCRLEIDPQPSASIHFTLQDCRTGTEALLQINGSQTRVRTLYIWTPNPRRIEHQYFIHSQVIDGARNLPLPITGPRANLGMLIYNW